MPVVGGGGGGEGGGRERNLSLTGQYSEPWTIKSATGSFHHYRPPQLKNTCLAAPNELRKLSARI